MPWNPYRDRDEEVALDAEMLAREAAEPLLDHHSLAAPGARADMEAFIARRVQERANGCTCPPWRPCRNDSAYGAEE